MGLFNTLRLPDSSTCAHCGHTWHDYAQLTWGECSINQYAVGETLEWVAVTGGRRVPYVIVGAIREGHCPRCRAVDEETEWFDVHIKNDVIVSVEPAPPGDDWHWKRRDDNEDYVVVEE